MSILEKTELSEWVIENFDNYSSTDIRRRSRILKIAEEMAKSPGKSLPSLFSNRYDILAAYNLFKHPESKPEKLQMKHRIKTLDNIKNEEGTFLLIEDTSEFVFNNRKTIDGLGPVGNGKDQLQGFHLHTTLAFKWNPEFSSIKETDRRSPLKVVGIADQQYYIREPIPKPYKSRKYDDRKRESDLWLNSISKIGPCPKNDKIRWIRIADRGADIYEYMMGIEQNKYNYIVRASQNRLMLQSNEDEKKYLFDVARNLTPVGEYKLKLKARPQHPARTACISISSKEVSIKAPQRPGVGGGKLDPIKCTVVYAVEKKPPEGQTALEWIIITNLQTQSFDEILQVIRWYASRWVIEDYHKAIKSGMKAENLQLKTSHSLFSAISIMAIVALRLVDIREKIRLIPDAPKEELGFSELELTMLEAFTKKELKTVLDVGMALGKVGGHMGRKGDGIPGMITLWRGHQKLKDMVSGVQVVLENNLLTKFV